jgi:alpha-beta hydrolase superfamily lysophospholipase
MDVDGVALRRVEWVPDGEVRTAAVFVHGQGDCSGRHGATVAALVERGIACCAFDWPGHGGSPGRPGVVPGFGFLSAALGRAAEECGERFGVGATGWLAHSAGGLVLLHHLAATGAAPEFVWLNAPLVDVRAGRSALVVALGRVAARLFPNLRISTGVKAEDCRKSGDAESGNSEIENLESRNAERVDSGWEGGDCPTHHWITLGWAGELLRLGEGLEAAVGRLSPEMKVLFTQGLEDPVCPPESGRRLFERLPAREKRWVGIEGGRHECFADGFAPELKRSVGRWLDAEVLI